MTFTADKPKRGRNVLIWIERSLLMLGVVLAGIYGAARIESRLASRAALKKFAAIHAPVADATSTGVDAERPSITDEDLDRQINLPEVDFTLWGERRILSYQQNGGSEGIPLAVLRIPKIHLEAPLFDGTDEVTLNHAVGRIAGTAKVGEPGNLGIAGHRDSFFRGLKNVGVGDTIELETLNGTSRYIVENIRVVLPRQVEVLRPTAVPSLTLVTCYPFYFVGSAPQRYIVTASLSPEIKGDAENLGTPSAAMNSTRRTPMNIFNNNSRLLTKGAAGAVLATILALGTAWAQDSTVTTTTHGQPAFDMQVKNAEVVYVEGNDLVLKLENGRIEHLVVPDSDKFMIDGHELTVHELVPGTRLTQTITTTTTPRYISSVRTLEGKVWHVNAPRSIILTLPDHKNHIFDVPNDAKFSINGQEMTVFDLRKGMNIKATIMTDDTHTIVEQTKVAVGQAPPLTMPHDYGVLLFMTPLQPQVTLASAEQPAEMLPETGSVLPLVGLLGTLAIAMSLGLWAVRRTGTI